MSKRAKLTLFTVFFLAGFIYLSLWAYSAVWFKQEIDHLYANAQKQGVEFLGPKPILTNFPLIPHVIYHGGIKTGNASILFPQLIIKGYPIPFTTLSMNFPLGVSLDGIADPKVWSLDQLKAELAVPYHLPQAFTQESLSTWRRNGGKLEIRDYLLQKKELTSTGKGSLSLDEHLQPIFRFESTIQGHEAFIKEQSQAGLIEPFAAAVGTSILNGLAKTDSKTGEKTVTLKVSVENRLLSVGPLQVLDLPEIVWDTRMPLALRQ